MQPVRRLVALTGDAKECRVHGLADDYLAFNPGHAVPPFRICSHQSDRSLRQAEAKDPGLHAEPPRPCVLRAATRARPGGHAAGPSLVTTTDATLARRAPASRLLDREFLAAPVIYALGQLHSVESLCAQHAGGGG